MRKWEVINKSRIQNLELRIDKLLNLLIENRGIKTKKERDAFLNPNLDNVTIESVGINKVQLRKALHRIKKAIEKKEQIVIFGDYDVDGICGTAILWETLYALGARVTPYIPHRVDEGYGLSTKGIQNLESRIQDIKLIITVDNGIVAHEAVSHAKKQGVDVIITDHHVPSKKLPKAYAIVHTTKLCGAGVAYLLAQEILRVIPNSFRDPKQNTGEMLKPIRQAQGLSNNRRQVQHDRVKDHLELVALATVADLVPLTGANRILLTFGLEALRKTTRIGLLELFKEAALDQKTIDPYVIGHMIAPRLNAMGRMEYAMESLRLLCTKSQTRAKDLATKLGSTNRERQLVTEETVLHALTGIKNQELGIKKLLFVAHKTYQQGVIGLVAGKLVEEFYRPAIVVSVGEKLSKASARSISGFNIIEFIRSASDLLVDAGGHPMAAGFTVETTKLALLETTFTKLADKALNEDLFTRTLRIDVEIPLSCINVSLHAAIQQLAPFGMGNPEPTFVSKGVTVGDMRLVGRDGKHVKFKFGYGASMIDGIAFGLGERAHEFHIGDTVAIVYTIAMDQWNGNSKLQLKIKDLKSSKPKVSS